MLNEFVLLVLLVVVASLLSISVEWHVALACLWLTYVVSGAWLITVATPELAMAKVATGTTVCALLMPGLRGLSEARARRSGLARRLVDAVGSSGADEPFMLVGAVLVAAAAVALSSTFPIVEGASNFAWYWLGLLGLLLVMLARDLVRVGIGLLLLLGAVDLLDTMVAQNQGVGAIGARSVATITLALALARIWSVLQARAPAVLHAPTLSIVGPGDVPGVREPLRRSGLAPDAYGANAPDRESTPEDGTSTAPRNGVSGPGTRPGVP